jgi:ribokinase
MKPIVVVGSINMDMVTQAPRIPRPGETVTGTGFQLHSGGKGANQAVAAAKLGHPCVMLGAVGDDVFGRDLLRTLEEYGVDTQYVATVPGPSGTASIVVDSNAENSIIVTPGSNACVTVEYIRKNIEIVRNAGIVLLQLEIPLKTVEWLVHFCSENHISTMLDPAPAKPLSAAVLKEVDWFTPNQTEVEFYTGNSEATETSLSKLFQQGLRNIILKRGSEGALIADASGSRFWIEAFPVAALDTTAAGDAFNGAFAVALMRAETTVECGRFASAAAAISVTRSGAQPSLPTQKEVDQFSQEAGVVRPVR